METYQLLNTCDRIGTTNGAMFTTAACLNAMMALALIAAAVEWMQRRSWWYSVQRC